MKLALIAAVARNGVVGRNNQLPWHIPADLQYFKKITMGKPIVMGRLTYESIGRPLPERTNIVVTRDHSYQPKGVEVVHSLEDALALGGSLLFEGGELMVIGGAQIYTEVLPLADVLYLTEVDAEVEGDAFFPEVDWADWEQVSRCQGNATDTGLNYSFVMYKRVKK